MFDQTDKELTLDGKTKKDKESKLTALPSSKPGRLMLLNWVDISEKRFNEILSTVTKAKNDGLRTNVDGREILLDNTESWLQNLGNGILDWLEFKSRYNNIVDDIEVIVDKPMITRNREKIVQIMSLLREIIRTKFDKKKNRYYSYARIRE